MAKFRKNEKLAECMERKVRSSKRARVLRKRGEVIHYEPNKRCWIWVPHLGYEETFVCPKCGSTHFGTSNYSAKGEMPFTRGHCHGPGCHYWWDRGEDSRVFQFIRRRGYARSKSAVVQHYTTQPGKGKRAILIVGDRSMGAVVAQQLRARGVELPVITVQDEAHIKEPWKPDLSKMESGFKPPR